ncbi:MAG TPA: hypothetical protein VFY13_06940 [Luteolibacter sp.]|nr:hypothetical protein [Luteolibacter sp.]
MPRAVRQPEQELRFTRAAQSVPYWCASAMLVAAAVTWVASSFYRDLVPDLFQLLWALPALIGAVIAGRIALHLTRHAYLILTPLGIEILPLWRPQRSMQVVFWTEITDVETDPKQSRLTLHFDAQRRSGIHLTLRPIPRERRALLIRAVMERVGAKR